MQPSSSCPLGGKRTWLLKAKCKFGAFEKKRRHPVVAFQIAASFTLPWPACTGQGGLCDPTWTLPPGTTNWGGRPIYLRRSTYDLMY